MTRVPSLPPLPGHPVALTLPDGLFQVSETLDLSCKNSWRHIESYKIQSPRINLAPSKLNWMRLGEIIVIKIQNNSAKLNKDHVLAKRCSQNLATPGFNVNMTYYGINNWRCNDVMGKWVKLYLRCPPYSLISSSYVPNFKLYFALRHDKHECVLMKCSGGIFSHCILHWSTYAWQNCYNMIFQQAY